MIRGDGHDIVITHYVGRQFLECSLCDLYLIEIYKRQIKPPGKRLNDRYLIDDPQINQHFAQTLPVALLLSRKRSFDLLISDQPCFDENFAKTQSTTCLCRSTPRRGGKFRRYAISYAHKFSLFRN